MTPEKLLSDPRATGAGVRVCLLDSGVDRAYLEKVHNTHDESIERIDGAIFTNKSLEPLPYLGKQSSPHGTTVADIILRQAPRVRLFSADVFGPRGSCEVGVIVRALRWAMNEWDCKIVNLSLGITEQRLQQIPKRQELLRAIEEAYYRDVLVIAAADNDHPNTKSYPADFGTPLLGVDKHVFGQPLEFDYLLRAHVEFRAHSKGYVGPFSKQPATSWAAAHLTGIAARLMSLRPRLKPFELKTLLYWMSSVDQRRETPVT